MQMGQVNHKIVSQHAEEAAIIWLLRRGAVQQPHFLLDDLAHLDGRLEAHLDGLRIAGDAGWVICLEEMKSGEPEDLFPAAVRAFESGDRERIDLVLRGARGSCQLSRAVVSALGWLRDQQAAGHIDHLLNSDAPAVRRIGIAAAAAHRHDPGTALERALVDDEKRLRARALRAVGELGRKDLLPAASEAMQSSDRGVRFWSAWSLARLGDVPRALEALRQSVDSQSPEAYRALQLVLRRMEADEAASWLRRLAEDSRSTRMAAIGAGVAGRPDAIERLLEMMATPQLARVAGEAFSMITGAEFAAEKLEAAWPEGFSAGPTEYPRDDNVGIDEDENLLWPDAAKLAAWWKSRRSEFSDNTRYLCGRPVSDDRWLEEVLGNGYQRQRAAAALELALLRPDQPLFNVCAPGRRQQELLGLRNPAPEN